MRGEARDDQLIVMTREEIKRASNNEDKRLKPLKFDGVPETAEPISAASGPKFTILWEHVNEVSITTGKLKSKPEVEFQHGCSWFSQPGSGYNSAVD